MATASLSSRARTERPEQCGRYRSPISRTTARPARTFSRTFSATAPDSWASREAQESLAQQKGRLFAGLRGLVRALSLDPEGVARLARTDPAAAHMLTRPTNRAAIQIVGLLNRLLGEDDTPTP